MKNLNENPEAILEAKVGEEFLVDDQKLIFRKTLDSDHEFHDTHELKDEYYFVSAFENGKYLYLRDKGDNDYASITKERMIEILKSGEYKIEV